MKLQTDTEENVIEISSSRIRKMVSESAERESLNEAYLALSWRGKQYFHEKFAKIFRGHNYNGTDDIWKINFSGKQILMPLKKERMWLDWDSAVSVLGHDIEVKQTYEQLIESDDSPELFIDIGANYGTHSLLFLSNGIKTLTFEPNASCIGVFKEICSLNSLKPEIKAVALGRDEGYVQLTYPEERTWFGSTDSSVARALSDEHEVQTEKVLQKPLDGYSPVMKDKKVIIKIDTEGNELAVLHGAEKTLNNVKPIIIFESFGEGERNDLFNFLSDKSYQIFELPWDSKRRNSALTFDQFLSDMSSNFIAVI